MAIETEPKLGWQEETEQHRNHLQDFLKKCLAEDINHDPLEELHFSRLNTTVMAKIRAGTEAIEKVDILIV